MPPTVPATAATEPAAATAPDDANDLRGFHFKRLLAQDADAGPDRRLHDRGGDRRRGPGRPAGRRPRRRRGAPAVALLVVFAIADSRAEEAFFQTYAEQRGARTRRPRAAAAGDAAAAQGRRPLRRAHPLRPVRRRASRASSLSIPTRRSRRDSDGNRQTNYYRYTVGLVPVPECAELRARALLPAQVRPALAGEVRGRLPPLQTAGQAGERGRSTRSTRSSPARTRTQTGCAGSSPPPSSSG